MTEPDAAETHGPQAPPPHPRLRDLDVLEGAWRLEGHDLDGGCPFTGTMTGRWLPGGGYHATATRQAL